MLVKPAPGLALRDPATMQRVPEEGLEVPDLSPLWNRMLADGDVVKVDAKAEAEAPKPPAPVPAKEAEAPKPAPPAQPAPPPAPVPGPQKDDAR